MKVGSGSFRIAREEALEKLQRFQLPNAARFLPVWVRAATASGATRVAADAGEGWLTLRFDGEPLAPEVFTDPVAGLLGEVERGQEAAREFAVGYLGAWRHDLSALELESGSGAGRRRLRAEPNWTLSAEAPLEQSSDTVIKLAWSPAPSFVETVLQGLREECMLGPEVRVRGEELPRHPPGSKRILLKGGRWAWLRRRSAKQGFFDDRGLVRVVKLGTVVQTVATGAVFKLVDAALRDDDLKVDISQAAIVQDSRLEAGLEILDEAADAYLNEELKLHKKFFSSVVARLPEDPALLAEWSAALGGKPSERLSEAAERMEWLRETAAFESSAKTSPWKESVRRRLSKAPLILGAFGNPLSLRRVKKLSANYSVARYATRRLAPDELSGLEPVLILCKADKEFVRRLLGVWIRDVTPSRFLAWVREWLLPAGMR